MVKSSPDSVRQASETPSALEVLRRNEERYRQMVSSVRDYAIFMLDTAGRVESWNAGAEAIKGYKAEEILGHDLESPWCTLATSRSSVAGQSAVAGIVR